MHRPRTRSQVRRDDEKAERRRAMKEEKAGRHWEREKRRATAQDRKSGRQSDQQTIHESYVYEDRNGNTHDSRTEIREIHDGGRRATVKTTTNTFTITSPTYTSSLPYRNPRPEPYPTSAYTGEKPHSQTYYTEERQPLAEEHRDTHGYQSTSSQTPAKPRIPSQQPSTPHRERRRRRGKAPPSVIKPACISEPETVVAAPEKLRPKDVVTMLPTPPPSVTNQPPPAWTKYTRAPSQTNWPATNARQTGSGSSWQYHGRATRSTNAPSIPPATRSATTKDGSHILPTKEGLRRSATTMPLTPSRPASPPTDSQPHQRGGLPSIFDKAPNSKAAWVIYDNTTASEFHRNKEAPISSQSEQEPSPTKTPSTAKTTEGENTKMAAQPRGTGRTTSGTGKKRRPPLGANIGYDPRDTL